MKLADDIVLAALVESGDLDAAGLDAVRRQAAGSGVPITKALQSAGLVSPRLWAIVKAETGEVPFVDLSAYDPNFANASLVPMGTAESLRAFPLFICGGVATVGMADPLDFKSVDQIRAILKLEVDPVQCEAEALAGLIERAYGITGGSAGAKPSAVQVQGAGDELTTGKEPIVAAVNQILAQGVELGASDIHVGPDEHELHLRYRIDGVLRSSRGPGLENHAGIVQRLKVMADLDLTQSRRPQDGKFRFTHHGREVDVRLSLIPTVCGENAVLRLLSSASSIRGFNDLGFPPDRIAEFESLIEQPYGMVLVTGPTGSGKTTTLYTALKWMNSADTNIMTIEDPVEIRMPVIRQVQVNAAIGMTFAGALRSILRQDPDVVFVGEIRDEETARISVQAALTGHLVLSSLHTNDAAGAVPRLRDLSCPPFAINAALLCVIAQRLVRRVCPDCARPAEPARELLRRFGVGPGAGGFVRGAGCQRCAGQGMRGRLGIYEMLTMNAALRDAVERGDPAAAIHRIADESGMSSMARDGAAKAMIGLTTLEEVARAVTVLDEGEAAGVEGESRRAA